MSRMIDHASIRVSDLERSARLYEAALAELGYERLPPADELPDGPGVTFAWDEEDDFSIHAPIDDPGRDTVTTGVHLAFIARSRAEVDAFHRAALAHGGRDIGAPGIRDQYSAGYYGGFVLDHDGNSIEAVYHEPED